MLGPPFHKRFWHGAATGVQRASPSKLLKPWALWSPLLRDLVQVNCDREVVKRDQRVLLKPDINLVSLVFFFLLSSVLKQ